MRFIKKSRIYFCVIFTHKSISGRAATARFKRRATLEKYIGGVRLSRIINFENNPAQTLMLLPGVGVVLDFGRKTAKIGQGRA